MRFHRLADWLAWQDSLHPREIELGLGRCRQVLRRMSWSTPAFTVITVAGTNGKGSCVAMLESILRTAGYRVGVYTSPHLVRYNERVRINGVEASDDALMSAFDRVDLARDETSLTYFEFGTLAAMELFRRETLDVVILEVGLGGRLDAVNLFDPHSVLVTTIDIDHVDWLGGDREAIGREKAGTFRPGRPAISGERDPPVSLEQHAIKVGAPFFQLGNDFITRIRSHGWDWQSDTVSFADLPFPTLSGRFQLDNAAAVIMVLQCLTETLPVSESALHTGLREVTLNGRFQVLPGRVERIVDVAHNVQAARSLAATLASRRCVGRTLGVFGMLNGKDIRGVIGEMRDVVDAWYVTSLSVPRGLESEELAQAFADINLKEPVHMRNDVAAAHADALRSATPEDRVIIFGSFYTVGEILRLEGEV